MTDIGRLASVEDCATAAAAALDPVVFDYYRGGAGSERTVAENEAAWRHWVFRKRVLVDVSDVSTRTTVLGADVATPVLVAPTAFHKMAHADGEVATAQGTAAAGSLMVLATLSTVPLEEVAATGVTGWFQLYIHTDRGLTRELAERAAAAGLGAIVLTVDTPQFGARYRDRRNRFQLPAGCELANLAGRSFPDTDGSGLEAYSRLQMDASITWDDVGWLRDLTPLPLVAKGVTTAEDARRCVDAGFAALVVSNHGGRQLDGDRPTADALPEVVDAVGGDIEVLVDGGIRHGAQVLTALALGARAVLVGRPVLWGLAAGGAAGVEHVLRVLTEGLVGAMQCAGVSRLADADRGLVMPLS